MKETTRNLLARLLLLLGIAIFTCVTAFANPGSQLNVTDDQKAAIQAIIRQANDQVRQVKAENDNAHNRRRLKKEFADIRAIRTSAMKEIKEKLTPEQQASMEQLLSGAQHKKEDRQEFLQSLDLTRQQKIQIAKILAHAQDAAWETAGNSSLDFTQIRSKIHQVYVDAMQNIRRQLTTDQRTKLDTWQKNSTR
jgi:Spy/CpxP family protein refolding chaperone